MSLKASGQVRRSQIITTWGPGAPIDLPRDSGLMGGLEAWPRTDRLTEVVDPRLARKVAQLTELPGTRLFAPPPDNAKPGEPDLGIGVVRFPTWMLVQEEAGPGAEGGRRSRRLVTRRALDKGRFDRRPVVATRFVRACPRGHIADLDWYGFVKHKAEKCRRQLWLDERGTGGDLGDLTVRCECGGSRPLREAAEIDRDALGQCDGSRPWLGSHAEEPCGERYRLLIRTAANAYFPQVLSALSLPEAGAGARAAVERLWAFLQTTETPEQLTFVRQLPDVATGLAGLNDEKVLEAIDRVRGGGASDRPVKQVELDALLAAPDGYGDDVPVDPNFHARRLPEAVWRRTGGIAGLDRVIQLHRLREVLALVGFTRFESITPDIDGEYDTDVARASLALDPAWFPAVENRGEGLYVGLKTGAVAQWLARSAVKDRIDELHTGHERFKATHPNAHEHPGGPYVLLHTLSHLLIQALALTCGYPASSIRERIYVDRPGKRYGLLLYTATPDAEGTLGGLVQQARRIEAHIEVALRAGQLCSNDPVCAQHSPGHGMEGRWLHGAACHGCALVAETSCEMRNDLLDRALVVPTLATPDAAFFAAVP